MLKKIRVALAWVFWIGITLLFLDFTDVLHGCLGWMAKVQFLPALLALNVGVVVALVLLTLLFGRIYCSVICPLGVFQDGISHLRARKSKKPYAYHKEMKVLRYGVLVVFIICLVAGVNIVVSLLAPYSAYGRMVESLLHPRELWGNYLLAIAGGTLLLVGFLAWRYGRAWCNSVCPVGTILSFLSRFAMFRPVIDADKCKHCKACEHQCKAHCIAIGKDSAQIDYSRCVDCFNCLDQCKFGALQYRFAWKKMAGQAGHDAKPDVMPGHDAKPDVMPGPDRASGRRAFIAGTAVAVGAAALKSTGALAQKHKKLDGGLAEILPKQAPERETPLTPPGSKSVKHFYQHCNACMLCVAQCPNNVLRPSSSLEHLMEPEMGFENGWCRPECTRCSGLCPTGSIVKVTREQKTQYHVGTARVNPEACLSATGKSLCGKCAEICPSGAILMVEDAQGHLRPSVAEEACTGCGACEYYCPIRPISAITVNGKEVHV